MHNVQCVSYMVETYLHSVTEVMYCSCALLSTCAYISTGRQYEGALSFE